MRRDGYSYFASALRHSMSFASSVRLDHVIGLHRIWWVPDGLGARQGAYVRYRADELYAIVRLEAHLTAAAVVGEDLGTVPQTVRRKMRRDELLRSFVFEFESSDTEPLPGAPRLSIASIATHDLAPFASYWRGLDIEERHKEGVLDEARAAASFDERSRWRGALWKRLCGSSDAATGDDGGAGTPGDTQDLLDDEHTLKTLRGSLVHLASSAAALVVVDLEDLWLETEPQNRPGTGSEAGNFARKASRTLEQMGEEPAVAGMLGCIDAARRDSRGG